MSIPRRVFREHREIRLTFVTIVASRICDATKFEAVFDSQRENLSAEGRPHGNDLPTYMRSVQPETELLPLRRPSRYVTQKKQCPLAERKVIL